MKANKIIPGRLIPGNHVLHLSLVICPFLLSGCGGARPLRELGGLTYSEFVYSLPLDNETSLRQRSKMVFPMTLAVAQIGETSPQVAILAKMRSRPGLIKEIIEVPFLGEESLQSKYPPALENPSRRNAVFRERIQKALTLSKKLGADHLFMIGGQSESRTLAHPIEILDLAIVPAFAVPSKKVKVEAKMSGASISVEPGDVMFLVNAMAQAEGVTSRVYRKQKRESLSVALRSGLGESVAKKLIERLDKEEGEGALAPTKGL